MIETADKQHEDRYKNRWHGKYRAFVRDNNDPERLGCVRMEIPAVLGTGRENWSEWAYPCFPYGGNDDTGFFLVPEEGASVWAEFEGGIVQHPIWTGVWLAMSNPGEQPEEPKREGQAVDAGTHRIEQAQCSQRAINAALARRGLAGTYVCDLHIQTRYRIRRLHHG